MEERNEAPLPATREVVRQRGKRGDRKHDILEVARQLFVEKGAENTTMAEIADQTGIAEGTVYLYFGSKRELISGVAVHWTRQMLESTLRQLSVVDRLTDKLTIIVQNHLTFMLHHSDLYFLFFREIRASADYGKSELLEMNRLYTEPLRSLLTDVAPGGRSSTGLSAAQMRDVVYGGVEHVGWGAVVQGKAHEIDIPDLARKLSATFLKAFGIEETGGTTKSGDASTTGGAPEISGALETRLQRIELALGLQGKTDDEPTLEA